MSVVTQTPEQRTIQQSLESVASNEQTFAEALARRFTPQVPPTMQRVLDLRFGTVHAVTEQDFLDFSDQFPTVASTLSRSQINDLLLDHKRNPGGMIGARNPTLTERLKAIGKGIHRTPEALVGGAAEEVFRTLEMLERGTAVVAELVGQPELAQWYRNTADSLANFNEVLSREVRGPEAAKFTGRIAAMAAPSAAVLRAAGGATKTLLFFFGLQAAGAADKELEEFGIEPSSMEWLLTVAGYAAAEVVTEKIGLDLIGRMGTDLARRVGTAMLRRDARQVATILFEAELISDVEGAEEALTQWLQNAIAKSQFDSERKLTEGLVQSFLIGKAMGGLLIVPASGRRFRAMMSEASEADVRAAQNALRRAAAEPEAVVATDEPGATPPAPAAPTGPVAQVVAPLGPRQRQVAERAAAQAARDNALTARQRAKARAITVELERTQAEVAAVEPVRVTQAEVAAFLQETGLGAVKAGVLEESQELEQRMRAERRAAAVGAPALRTRVVAAERAKGQLDQRIRRGLRRLVRTLVPPQRQGRFLGLIETGTPGEVREVIDEIGLTLADERSRDLAREVKAFERAVRKSNLRQADKDRILQDSSRAREFLFEGKRRRTLADVTDTRKRTEALGRIAEQAEESIQRASEAFADAAGLEEGRVLGELKKIDALISELVDNIDAPDQSALAEDNKGALIDRLKRQQADVRNIGRTIEGRHDDTSVIERLLFHNLIPAHDLALLQMAQRGQEIEQAAKRAGFKSLADAQAQLSRRGGRGVTQFVKIEIDDKSVQLSLGEALWFMAIDLETEALILAGAPVKLAVGRRTRKVKLTEDDLARIRAAAEQEFTGRPQNLRDFVADVKEISNQDFADVQSVVFDLTGREPPAVPDYFRRRRDTKLTETRGLPQGFRGVARRFAENLGFTRSREGGLEQAILVEDFLEATLDHVRQTAIVQHVAASTRTAAAVLLNESVQTAISAKAGTEAVEVITAHLEASSLVNPALQDGWASTVRFLNGSLAIAKLAGNPSSWMRQLGGIPRLAPFLGPQILSDGLNGWQRVTLDDLTSRRGFFWERYVSNLAGRFSPTETVGVLGDEASFKAGWDRALKNFLAGDLIGAMRVAREANMSLIQILNAFDAVNAKIAYAGYVAEAERQHPDWDLERRRSWAAEQSEAVIRETQNSSSVLDMATIGITSRGKWFSLFLLFRSDTFKSLNRIRRAANQDPRFGAQVIAAETVNIVWSRISSNTLRFLVVMMLRGLGVPTEEPEELAEKAEREALAVASEFAGLVAPVVGPGVVDLLRFSRAQIIEAPAMESVNDLARAITQMILRPPLDIAKGDLDKALENFFKGLGNTALEASSLAGLNPLDAMMRRILRGIDEREDQELQPIVFP